MSNSSKKEFCVLTFVNFSFTVIDAENKTTELDLIYYGRQHQADVRDINFNFSG